MTNIILLHGPNLNMLGIRDQSHYGSMTLKQLERHVRDMAKKHGHKVKCYQSNHEGKLIHLIQKQSAKCAGIIINPGALSHYSYALHDALIDCKKPSIEVHLSKISERETWRQQSVIAPACIATIEGMKIEGYYQALQTIIERITQ